MKRLLELPEQALVLHPEQDALVAEFCDESVRPWLLELALPERCLTESLTIASGGFSVGIRPEPSLAPSERASHPSRDHQCVVRRRGEETPGALTTGARRSMADSGPGRQNLEGAT